MNQDAKCATLLAPFQVSTHDLFSDGVACEVRSDTANALLRRKLTDETAREAEAEKNLEVSAVGLVCLP